MGAEETQDMGYPVRDEFVPDADTPTVPEVIGGAPFSSQSVYDLFKQEQAELANATEVFLPVKGYEPIGLQIQYRVARDGKELDAVGQKVNKQFADAYSRNLYGSMDLMILLCKGLFVQPDDVPEPVMFDPEDTGEPCLFDERLAKLMGMTFQDQPTARDVVKKLFGGDRGELAVIAHAERLQRWLVDAKADLRREIWQSGE